MQFAELDGAVREKIIEALTDHIVVVADILKKDRCLMPMLMVSGTKQLMSLQAQDGSVDVDRAYARVVELLKTENFGYALFSYSTRIGLASGRETDALKTHIFTSDGMEVSFYTPYTVKGIFKKSVSFEKNIFDQIKEGIFESRDA